MKRRTVTMDWSGLDDADADDRFFESHPRISSVNPVDLCSSGSDEDDGFEDSRMSFVSTISAAPNARSLRPMDSFTKPQSPMAGYDMWMSEPGDVKERRRRLLQDLGLASKKNMTRTASRKPAVSAAAPAPAPVPDPDPDPVPVERADGVETSPVKLDSRPKQESKRDEEPTTSPLPSSPSTSNLCSEPKRIRLVRSRSAGDMLEFSAIAKQRKEDVIGSETIRRLIRTSSEILLPIFAGKHNRCSNYDNISGGGIGKRRSSNPNIPHGPTNSDHVLGSACSIKNLDNGQEFVVKETNEQGLWNKVRDVQTGKQLTMDEFEKSTGSSNVVKELMGRQNAPSRNDSRKMHNSYLSKSFRSSKKKGVAFFKNIKEVTTSKKHDHKDNEYSSPTEDQKQSPNKTPSKWVKSRQHGLSHKEFTALHMSQEIQAHQGSIWTMKFNTDARLLATAGEDKLILIWEVQECEVASAKCSDDANTASNSTERPPLTEITPSEKWKKARSYWRKGSSIPDYVNLPETVFALSEKPICTFSGHEEDVLDVTWSKSHQLLSSSMDKTVRLWDLESKTCLKMFAHNDYVTCIQFNPVDDNYFMSGSLDAKIRIWNVPDRHVVDWIDVNEMVTAATYTPDAQGAIVGSQQGNCRFYTIADCKLECLNCVRLRTKAQAKKLPTFHSQGLTTNKITGFQFSPTNSSEVLITSTDSRIRLHNGSELVQKYRGGFKNTSSQIMASFSPDGRHVISSSEDSQIYIWKVEESRVPGGTAKKKTRVTVLTYENFTCKDVSVAIPWPGSVKNDVPLEVQSKRHSGGKKNLPPIPAPKKSSGMEDVGNSGRAGDPGGGVDSNGESGVPGTAWGLVIVAASLEGEIRVYQNFGLPVKVGRL